MAESSNGLSEIQAISPVFSYSPDDDRFCVIQQGKARIQEIGRRITGDGTGAGTGGLVAIYVTEDPEPDYSDDPKTFGRIVALVRPLPMPPHKTVEDHPSGCPDWTKYAATGVKVDRWPCGWPSEVVFYSKHGGPVLRDAVSTALHRHDFGAFAHQFLQGPIDLSKPAMAPLRKRLMLEVRNQITLNPNAQTRPF